MMCHQRAWSISWDCPFKHDIQSPLQVKQSRVKIVAMREVCSICTSFKEGPEGGMQCFYDMEGAASFLAQVFLVDAVNLNTVNLYPPTKLNGMPRLNLHTVNLYPPTKLNGMPRLNLHTVYLYPLCKLNGMTRLTVHTVNLYPHTKLNEFTNVTFTL